MRRKKLISIKFALIVVQKILKRLSHYGEFVLIVKGIFIWFQKGAKMSKDNVYEWELCRFFGGDWYVTNCQYKSLEIPEDNICPYCKKPIRVIEEEKDE